MDKQFEGIRRNFENKFSQYCLDEDTLGIWEFFETELIKAYEMGKAEMGLIYSLHQSITSGDGTTLTCNNVDTLWKSYESMTRSMHGIGGGTECPHEWVAFGSSWLQCRICNKKKDIPNANQVSTSNKESDL